MHSRLNFPQQHLKSTTQTRPITHPGAKSLPGLKLPILNSGLSGHAGELRGNAGVQAQEEHLDWEPQGSMAQCSKKKEGDRQSTPQRESRRQGWR